MTGSDLFGDSVQCHVVTLRKNPKSAADFMERNKVTAINFNIFDAVDGSLLSDDDAIRSGIIARGAIGYARDRIGSAASHRALWERCALSQQNLIIFEDDAFIRHDFKERVNALLREREEWDIILFGFNTDSLLDIEMIPECRFGGVFSCPFLSPVQLSSFVMTTDEVRLYRLYNAFGLCGYGISPKGARKLVQRVFPLDNRPVYIPYWNNTLGRDTFLCRGTDMVMNCYFGELLSYVCFPPLVLSPNVKKPSTAARQ
jgi:glycosyl transferase, family 25